MRILAFTFAIMCLVGLSGCLGDQRGRIDQSDDDHILKMAKEVATSVVAAHPQPVINVPPAEKVDTADLKNSINISSEKTANQMSGLLNTNISKLTDQIKGVEANIGKLFEINNQMTANLTNRIDSEIRASAEFKADLKAQISSNIELKANLQNQMQAIITAQNNMQADIKAVANLSAKLDSQISGIAGIGNSLSQTQQEMNNKANRDLTNNFLPKEAVYVILGTVLLLVVLLGIAFYFIFKSSINESNQRYQSARDQLAGTNKLLTRALTLLGKQKSGTVVVSASDMNGERDLEGDSVERILNDAENILKETSVEDQNNKS